MGDNGHTYVNDQIATIGGAKKFLDFKDALVPATLEDYAMLHGEGGKKHARISTIKLAITDYSNGTDPGGAGSVYVQANVPPALMEILRAKCLENIGTSYVPENAGLWPIILSAADAARSIQDALRSVKNSLGIFFTGMRQAAVLFYKNGDPQKDVCPSVGDAFRKAGEAIRGTAAGGDQDRIPERKEKTSGSRLIPLPVVHDYAYSQVRVNMYDRRGDDKVSVSQVNISRVGCRRDGHEARYPWTIQIAQFRAVERVAPNGTSSYDPKTVADKVEASISVTDEALYAAASRVCHFIEVWENAVCAPIVREGLSQREQARKTRRSR